MKLLLALCLLFVSCSPVYYVVKSESTPYVQTYYPRYSQQYNNNYPAGYYHPRYVNDYVGRTYPSDRPNRPEVRHHDRGCKHESVYHVNEYPRKHHRR